VGGELIPFEVKYRAQHTGARELKGLIELCQAKRIARGYVVTKSLDDFGSMQGLPAFARDTAPDAPAVATQIMRVPAPLLCYWMGATELPMDPESTSHHNRSERSRVAREDQTLRGGCRAQYPLGSGCDDEGAGNARWRDHRSRHLPRVRHTPPR
jgi:hypothetical protein